MKRSWICLLMVLAIVASGALVACGGSSKTSPTATAKQAPTASTPSGQATTAKQPTAASTASSGGSSGSVADVPVYPGATKITSGEFSGSSASIPAIGSDLNAADYTNVSYAIYQTSDSPQQVFDWYKSNMSGWKDEGSFSGSSEGSTGAFAAWSKDNGKAAAWIAVATSDNNTSLSIWYGSQ